MKIPESVLKKLQELEQKKQDRKNAARREKRRQKKVADALKKMKEDRMPELIAVAEAVTKWIGEFYESVEGRRLLKLTSQLRIFCSAYWQGFPVPEAHRTTFAVISLDDKGNVTYGERYNGFQAHEIYLDMNPVNPMVLVEALHPDYLVELAEHLVSGAVWDYIELFLPKDIY